MILSPDTYINKTFHPDDLNILQEIEASEKILFEKKSCFNNIYVTETNFIRFLKFDDSYQSAIINHPYYQGNLPYVNYFFLAPLINSDIKNILILGLGTGTLAHNFLQLMDKVKNIDIVEIDPEMVKVSEQYFGYKPDKRIKIHIQDARVFVRNSKVKYDLIILDIFSADGIPLRFITEEFIEEISIALSHNGLLISNLFGANDINSENNIIFRAIYKTYQSIFENIQLFPAMHGSKVLFRNVFSLKCQLAELNNMIIIAAKENILLNKKDLSSKAESLQDQFNSAGIRDIGLYAENMDEIKVNTLNLRNFKDDYESNPAFNPEDPKNFLIEVN